MAVQAQVGPLDSLQTLLQGSPGGARVAPGAASFLTWGTTWALATVALVLLAGAGHADVAVSVAVGIAFSALLVTGRRLNWW